ncbi:hypothetical protein ARMGADRAFT_1032605 [Armillaria gallica]|uniref:Uncharacterized protein n=1 Tax=Armillaria gallica TaxID=47427 RepID=A0A2H3DEX9_ARMGA|nr:hypothetical protein ARMGADRAFT_1032605 [Armillaria gallica]
MDWICVSQWNNVHKYQFASRYALRDPLKPELNSPFIRTSCRIHLRAKRQITFPNIPDCVASGTAAQFQVNAIFQQVIRSNLDIEFGLFINCMSTRRVDLRLRMITIRLINSHAKEKALDRYLRELISSTAGEYYIHTIFPADPLLPQLLSWNTTELITLTQDCDLREIWNTTIIQDKVRNWLSDSTANFGLKMGVDIPSGSEKNVT